MTTTLTTTDLGRMATDDRWEGFGYLGERRNQLEAAATGELPTDPTRMLVEATDQRVIDFANHRGLSYEELFTWANGKKGRWFGDVMFGGSGRFDARWQEAVRHNLIPA